MELLIENYLLRNKQCPLPKIGTLVLKEMGAQLQTGENLIRAPHPSITLHKKENSADPFICYIAQKQGIDQANAARQLSDYCNEIIGLDHRKEIRLNHTGRFYVDHDGTLDFKQDDIPEEFLPVLTVQKVIHPNSVHSVRVGDREHTTDYMKEQLKNFVTIKKSTWWLWALLLTMAAAGAIAYYLNFNPLGGTFGNGSKIQPSTEVKTYRAVN